VRGHSRLLHPISAVLLEAEVHLLRELCLAEMPRSNLVQLQLRRVAVVFWEAVALLLRELRLSAGRPALLCSSHVQLLSVRF
jgi:hypothetical protein